MITTIINSFINSFVLFQSGNKGRQARQKIHTHQTDSMIRRWNAQSEFNFWYTFAADVEVYVCNVNNHKMFTLSVFLSCLFTTFSCSSAFSATVLSVHFSSVQLSNSIHYVTVTHTDNKFYHGSSDAH